MKRLAVLAFAAAVLSGCASESVMMSLPPPEGGMPQETPQTQAPPPKASRLTVSAREIQGQLGMNRSIEDLGFKHKNFDGCRMSQLDDFGRCGQRVLSVVHFRLVCRDTVGTTTRIPSSLTPLSRQMEWRLGGVRGVLNTDSQGFGQVQMISNRPVQHDRFMLIIGTKTLGLEASEVSQIVLPGNWCGSVAYN